MPLSRESMAQKGIMPPHYLHKLPADDEERLGKMFQKLDADGNGRIDIHDLSKALHGAGIHKKYAERFLARSDMTKSGDITLAEFVHYVREHEKNLQLTFSQVDKNKDGKIDLEELLRAFKELGLNIDRTEALKLLKRIDSDGSLNITFNEWRDFFLYAPSKDIHELIQYWNHPVFVDIGEDIGVPEDFSNNEILSGMWWKHLVAGGIAGAASRTCTAPLDRIKVYLQVHGTRHCNIVSCFRYMVREGGFLSFWRGNGINVLKIGPETALKFMAYEEIKRTIKGTDTRELEIQERFMAGSLAGAISQSIIYPLEVLKTKLALRTTGEFTGIIDAIRKIYLHGGFRCFYRGYVPNLLGIFPYAGIDLAVYETLKNSYIRNHAQNNEQPGVFVLLWCGTVSSTAGQVCSYPLALVRTRLQAQVASSAQPTSTLHIFRDILQREGVRGFYRGIVLNFLKVIPAVSTSYVVYERVREAFGVNMT